MLFVLYKGLVRFFSIFLNLYFYVRLKKGRESRERLCERYGNAPCKRPTGEVIWFHAASVGELKALEALLIDIKAKLRPTQHILITTTTLSASKLCIQTFHTRFFHQLLPLDHPEYVKRFLAHWRPRVIFWSESDLWPCLLRAVKDIPIILLNGRLSEASFQRWTWCSNVFTELIDIFDLVMAQSPEDRVRFQHFTKRPILFVGNLKFVTKGKQTAQSRLPRLTKRLVWAAVSTHKGEEEILIQAHKKLVVDFPTLLLILAPRHPTRCNEVSTHLDAQGCSFARRTMFLETFSAQTQIFLMDTLGDLDWAYQKACTTFVGYSLNKDGKGHNIIEPALNGSLSFHGCGMKNFSYVCALFQSFHVDFVVHTENDIVLFVKKCLLEKKWYHQQKIKIKKMLDTQNKTLDTIYEYIAPYLRI